MLLEVCVCFLFKQISLQQNASFAEKMLKGKQMHVAMLYISLILKHVLESVIHPVEKKNYFIFIYLLKFMAYNLKGKIKKPRHEMQKSQRPHIKADNH